jgi:hypothetical protein
MAAQPSAGQKIAIVVLIVLFVGLLGVAFNMKSIVHRFESGRNEAFFTSMHESCLSSATQSAQAKGADVIALKPKIAAYCDCAVQEARNRIPPEQAESLDLTSPAGQSKMAEVAQACAGKLSQ